ncbi:MAG: hypothetical protein V5A62_18115 [Haloarculaceae archaeon]
MDPDLTRPQRLTVLAVVGVASVFPAIGGATYLSRNRGPLVALAFLAAVGLVLVGVTAFAFTAGDR